MSASVGSGHVQAAKALAEEFENHPETGVVVYDDALEHTNILHKQFYSDLYKRLSEAAPRFLGWWYETTDEPWKNDQVRLILDLPNALPLRRFIRETNPDVIICTHFMPAGVVSHLIANDQLKTRLYGVVTDYHFHAEWLTRVFNGYCVAHEEDRQHMIGLGIPAARIAVTGIPISRRFSEDFDRDALCRDHGLDPEKKTVLLSAGTLGLGPTTSVLKRILQMPEDFQTVVLCGKNKELFKDVEKLADGAPKKAWVMGYTEDMPRLMKSADVLLSKPGGLITAEALACGLPMIILNPIGGQEERNADVLLESGAAIKCSEVTLLPYKLGKLLRDPDRLATMKANATRMGWPDAAARVVNWVLADKNPPCVISPKRERLLRKKLDGDAL